MTLIVDFNMVDDQGLLPALISDDEIWKFTEGEKVLATDGEGTECQAEIVKAVNGPRGPYVLLSPIGGTWNVGATVGAELTTH
jgi:hypothetical protein